MSYFEIDEIVKEPITSSNLTELADYYETDKGKMKHNYTPIYEKYLKKYSSINLLELGIYKGSSLKMWASYFPKSQIYGVDINSKCASFCKQFNNIHITVADMHTEYNPTTMFDIILDDATHLPMYMECMFNRLWKNVKSTGYYIIEDTDMCSKNKWLKLVLKRYNICKDIDINEYIKRNTKKVFREFISRIKNYNDVQQVIIPNNKICIIQKK